MSSGWLFINKTTLILGVFIFVIELFSQGLRTSALANASAVVIMYHRFAEDKYPSTNTTVEQLDSHIKELLSGQYTILPVPEIVGRLAEGMTLPSKTIGITIDDAYRSVYEVAWPKFKAADLPITIFVSTAHIDSGSHRYMSWDQLRELVERGATIGHHTVSHLHMIAASRELIDKELTEAYGRFEEELGFRPKVFSYPYGEASLAIIKHIKDFGFEAAFGQHSGAIGRQSDRFYLPRFSMNETYGGLVSWSGWF